MAQQWSHQRWEKGSRYYEVLVQGDWVLTRIWGRRGTQLGRTVHTPLRLLSRRLRSARHGQGETQAPGLYALVGISVTGTRPKWMGLKVPGDTMVFWWPAGTDPDTYDADHGRAMDMAVVRYTELYGEAPEAEIVGKLAMVSDLEGDD